MATVPSLPQSSAADEAAPDPRLRGDDERNERARRVREWQWIGLLLLAPALALIALLFMLPLGVSIVTAFETPGGGFTLAHFAKAWEFYHGDFWATLRWTVLATLLIAVASVVIAGYLTLGENPIAHYAWMKGETVPMEEARKKWGV